MLYNPLIGNSIDILEKIKLMQNLKTNIENFSEELLKVEKKDNSLISTFGGIALYKKGIVLEVNEQFSNIFGYNKNKII